MSPDDTTDRCRRPRSVREFSAGGMVIDGLDSGKPPCALLIAHRNRAGGLTWSLPKGHIEPGERAEETAVREIREETGVRCEVLAALGCISYWFRSGDRRVHKTVRHFLLQFLDGELSTDDHEVADVAWVPIDDLPRLLRRADERQLIETGADLITLVRTEGRTALPPLPPSSLRRHRQPHSRAGRH